MPKVENITGSKELRNKILFTLALLIVYRLGIHVPVPGVNGQAIADFFASASNTLFGMFDMFSGGGLSRLSVFALGIMPYISASIILQLLVVVSPELERLKKKEGEAGRKKITQYTRYLTVLITFVQGTGIAIGLQNMTSPTGVPVVPEPGLLFVFVTVITLTSGTCFIMWLGEQITSRGLGNGISLIIFAGIVARLPGAAMKTVRLLGTGEMTIFIVIIILAMMLAVLAFICFMETSQRRIPIQYAKRMMGRKLYGGQTTHLPLRVNTAGVIPPIFASSILMFPGTISNFSQMEWLQKISSFFMPGSLPYSLFFVGLIIFFCFFYTAIIFDPKDIAENLKKQGGFIPGIRPGRHTKEYIDKVLSRITLWGSLYIAAICVLPMLLINKLNVPFYFGGTALLIVVGVAIDTMNQIQSHLISNQYEGLMQKGKLKGRL
ncbi:MAG: preprotein translocase subunit SecY [Desulfohalobiaceae bacterium]|nr:preprotein translocase subunit SecY [Desulfohalobiaceae bacterium]